VKYDLGLRRDECRPQRRQAIHRERVDHGRLSPGRDLQQVNPVVIPMKACRLSVHRQERLALKTLK
jgi:hypothetical protein